MNTRSTPENQNTSWAESLVLEERRLFKKSCDSETLIWNRRKNEREEELLSDLKRLDCSRRYNSPSSDNNNHRDSCNGWVDDSPLHDNVFLHSNSPYYHQKNQTQILGNYSEYTHT